MEMVTLGKTGITVNKNGFGALPIQRISTDDAVALARRAYEAGMTFFDTARFYTDSEEKLGEAFNGMREKVCIATKTAAQNAEDFWKDLHTSLTNLRTDYIDLYQFHNPAFCPKPGDGTGLYEAMEGCPVVIRFLDPPLHEFLPTKEEDIAEIAGELNISVEELKDVIASLHEFNPMMGHRGCRLAVTYPEIAEMQTTAVIKAAMQVNHEYPWYRIEPEIMIPLVGEVKELKFVKDVVTATADRLIEEAGVEMKYTVGTMIEIPRAALTADEIATEAEFFSFGTNDLTQMTFGFSRDDAGKFLDSYYDHKIYESDPFAHLDQKGVGKLVKMAAEMGRATRPHIKLGICGEHGGDPASVEFCHNVGLNYVSCSPFRVPIARLAAAQAAIREQRQ